MELGNPSPYELAQLVGKVMHVTFQYSAAPDDVRQERLPSAVLLGITRSAGQWYAAWVFDNSCYRRTHVTDILEVEVLFFG